MQRLARIEYSSVTTLLDRALRARLRDGEIRRTDFAFGPVVNQVLQERLRRTDAGLRGLIAATLHKVLRSQYVVLNSAVVSGASAESVEKWREEGWEFAERQFKEHRAWIREVLEDLDF